MIDVNKLYYFIQTYIMSKGGNIHMSPRDGTSPFTYRLTNDASVFEIVVWSYLFTKPALVDLENLTPNLKIPYYYYLAKTSSTGPTGTNISSTGPTGTNISSTGPTGTNISSTGPTGTNISSTGPTI